jgi:O-antigen/teichoic acid export membrane protein
MRAPSAGLKTGKPKSPTPKHGEQKGFWRGRKYLRPLQGRPGNPKGCQVLVSKLPFADRPSTDEPSARAASPDALSGVPIDAADSADGSGGAGSRRASANASSGGLARNALFGYGATIVGALSGLIVTPLLLAHLGSAQFGLWILLLSVVGYLGLLEVGLYLTVSKRVAECLAVDDRERLRVVLGTACAMYGALSLLVVVVAAVLAANVQSLFNLSGAGVETARLCLWVLGLNQASVFLFRLMPTVLFGAGRMDLLTSVATFSNLGAAAVNIFLAMRGYSIVALACSTMATTFVSGVIAHRLIARQLPFIEIHPRHARPEMARELLKFGSRNAALSIAGTIAFGADALVIGLLLPVANVAHYAVASKLINLVKELCQKPVDVLLPAFSHNEAQGDGPRQFQLWSESISLSMVICLPFVVGFWALGDRIVRAWVGAGHEASYSIGAVLGLVLLLQLPGHASFTILTGTERNTFLVRLYVVAAATNLAVSLFLTSRLGPMGVALGSLFTVFWADFLVLPWFVCRQFNFGYSAYLSRSLAPLLPALVGALVAAGCSKYLLGRWQVPEGALSTCVTLLLLGATVLVSWAAWVWRGLNAARRASYARAARGALGRVVPGM